jgi:hypothetical protein
MLNIFGRKKSARVQIQSPIKKINEAALSLIASANASNRGTRLVTNGAALEIVRRSLVKTDGQSFSVQKMHALKEVSEYISLAQRNKVVTASAAHFDLLPIGHPSAKRDHRLSREDLLRARARWFADDSLVVDDNVRSLLATAFIADPESPEHQYAVARLTAMGAHRVPVEALVAAALGFNDGANRGFWRKQLRDRKGQFAKMGGKLRKLINKLGQVFAQYGDVVSANPNDETFVMETPDGRLIRTEASRVETEVQAILPSRATPDGVSAEPVRSSSADPVDDENNLVYVDQPDGFLPKSAPSSPRGLDPQNFDRVWEDDLGNYQVIRGNFREGEEQDYVVSRLEQDEVVPIGVGKRWSEVVDILDTDEPKFQAGDDAEPNIPEGFDIGPAPREEIDPANLTPDELAAGYGFTKNEDGSYTADGQDGAVDISPLPNGQWNVTQRTDDAGGTTELGSYENPDEAFDTAQVAADTPEFDPGQVVDFREDQGLQFVDEIESDEPKFYEDMSDEELEEERARLRRKVRKIQSDIEGGQNAVVLRDLEDAQRGLEDIDEIIQNRADGGQAGGLYEVDRGPYEPQGPQDGVESDNYTDDPVELAQNYDSEELEGALEEAVRNGSGEALIPFNEGDEYVPAEALYNALKEQDRDPDRLLDDIYEGTEPTPQPEEVAPDLGEDEDQGPLTPEQIAELRSETDLPALLDSLSDEELAEVFNNEDYSAYLPENEEFDVPEGKYELDPEPFGANEEFTPEGAPEDAPVTAVDLAVDMSSEDLEQLLRGAVNGEYDRLGYGRVNMPDADGEDFQYDVPAEAIRDALQLQGIDTNEILREAYDGGEMEPDEIDNAVEGEGLETEEVFGLSQEDKDKLIAATKEGGYTVNFVTGEVPTDGYMVASEADVPDGEGGFRKREEVVSREDFDAEPIKYLDEFTSRNIDKLKEDGYYIGTWTSTVTDEETGEEREYVFFDVSERIEDKEEALQAARDRNEIAIFGIEEFEEFFTDPEREAQKNAGQEAPEGDDESSEQLPGDDGAGTPGVAEGDQPSDSGEPEQQEVGPLGRTYDISDWEQVGGQTGSNEGGLYRDADGNEYYVKFPPQKQLRNELLASALYESAGVPVGRVYLGRDADGNEVLVSPMLQNAEPLGDYLNDPNIMEEAAYYFPVDAWLNNWDSVGLVYDNMVVVDGRVFRIDAGGSLLFRAQGGDKALPEDVQVIDSLRNPDVNQQAATVYGDLTDDNIRGALQQMLFGTDDETIDSLVDAAFPDDAETSNLLKERLKSRREYLIGRFDPVTPEQLDRMGEGEEQDFAEQLQEAQEKVDAAFADNPLVLDFDGDIEAQINDALANERDLVFSYNGVDRVVRPVAIETNEKTGNTNISAVDGDGNFTKFTISKMSVASNSDDTVNDVVGQDSEGDEVETDDASVPTPQGLADWEKDLLDSMYKTEGVTSQDIEDFGEQSDVDDDGTSEYVSKVDSYDAEAPAVATPEQKVMADAVEELINPEEDEGGLAADLAALYDKLVNGVDSPENTESDLIWQRVQDEYDSTVLENGHIVVSSVMHGDRRYDVVVRRANDNTFHIYHRVTYPDGSTKVKEMGGQGWHSAEALFTRVESQIFNSKSRPKTTVNKGLKQENNNTLYADTSTPTQPGSYVASDGSVVKAGDRITVVNPTHSKFGMGARIVSTKRKYKSDGKGYTDYLRVRYDDGTKNNIVATSVVPEDSSSDLPAPAFPAKSKLTPNPAAVKVAVAKPGDTLSGVESVNLPIGAVVLDNDGRYWEHTAGISWTDLNTNSSKVLSASESFTYFAPDRDAALDKLGAFNPDSDVEVQRTIRSAPSSWTTADRDSNGDAVDEFTLPDDDDVVIGRLGTFQTVVGSTEFKKDFGGFDNQIEMESALTEYLEAQGKTVRLPAQKGIIIQPGTIARESFYEMVVSPTESTLSPRYVIDSVDFETGRVSVVALTGPDKTKRFVDIDPNDLRIEKGAYLPVFEAASRFGIEYSKENLQDIRSSKSVKQNPGFYSNPDAVAGPGAEAPQFESLPDWGSAPEGVISTLDALKQVRQWDSLGDVTEKSMGIYTLMDSTSIEDGQVRIQQVSVGGDKKIRLTGKLTSWFANETFIPAVTGGEIEAQKSDKIKFNFYEENENGLSLAFDKYIGSEFRVDENNNGETYTYTAGRGYEVKVHRAVKSEILQNLPQGQSEVDFFGQRTGNEKNNVSLHNMFDILLPEDATSGDIQRALESLGVQQARPATDVDVKILKENKLITVFGKKRDGTKNFTGVLREQELQRIQEKFGITADDLELEVSESSNQRPQILLSQARAQKLVDDYKISHFYHRVYTSNISGVDAAADRLIKIFESGALQSTTSRMLSTRGTGQSSSDDLNRPAADYTFLYAVTESNTPDQTSRFNNEHWNDNPSSNETMTVILDPVELMRRLDFYTNPGDDWGAMSNRIFDPYENFDFFSSVGEAMFKYDVPISSFRGIAMTAELRQAVVAELRARGIDFINGNDVEQLVQASVDKWRDV